MIAIGSDQTITLVGLYDNVTGLFQNDASVSGSLLDAAGVEVTTFTLLYLLGSDGDYQGKITAAITANLTPKAKYTFRIVATADSNTLKLYHPDVADYFYG